MTKLPVVDFRTFERVLQQLGFEAVRQKGSHVVFRHADGRGTAVPNHPCRDLSRALIRNILREIDVSPEEYMKLLNQ
jgi:predicted RNA binding protein YcfA (HicA-like mRNA interferase family)